jgi:hypothetical protein
VHAGNKQVTWCWGDAEGNTLREGVHRYVKAVYFDAWDARATADDPYVLVVSGDLARVSFSGKVCTLVVQSNVITGLFRRNSQVKYVRI